MVLGVMVLAVMLKVMVKVMVKIMAIGVMIERLWW